MRNLRVQCNVRYYVTRAVRFRLDIKGAWSRGFRRFLVKTMLSLSVANFIHAQHCVLTFKQISLRENKL